MSRPSFTTALRDLRRGTRAPLAGVDRALQLLRRLQAATGRPISGEVVRAHYHPGHVESLERTGMVRWLPCGRLDVLPLGQTEFGPLPAAA